MLLAAVVVVVSVVVAVVLERRRPEAPTQSSWAVPAQVDRADFTRPDAPWLVAVFTSATDLWAAVAGVREGGGA